MVKQARVVDYKELTISTIKEKYTLALLGLAVFSVFVISTTYVAVKYPPTGKPTVQSNTTNNLGATPYQKLPTIYLVKEGEYLAAISIKMYGTAAYVEELMKANDLYTPESLEVGKALIIPAVTPKPTFASQGEIDIGIMTGKVTITANTYTVLPGESLSDIATKVYGDPNAWVRIAQENGITNPNVVTEGMILKIPRS